MDIHGIFRDGGLAANVIPAYASLEYYFRGTTMAYVKELTEKAIKCAEGACAATGTTFKTSIYECPYDDVVINYTLCDMLKEQYEASLDYLYKAKEAGIEAATPVIDAAENHWKVTRNKR